MKHEITKITANEFMDFINAESLPDLDKFSVKCYQLGDEIFVHLSSGIGSLTGKPISASAKPKEIESFLDAEVKKFTDLYNQRKESSESFENKVAFGALKPDTF